MGHARHLLSLTLAALAMAVATMSVGGCGSSDGDGGATDTGTDTTSSKAPAGATAQNCGAADTGVVDLRVSGVDCKQARDAVVFWRSQPSCSAPAGASRVSCSVAGYHCLGASVDRGLAVSCARPGRSISFVARRG